MMVGGRQGSLGKVREMHPFSFTSLAITSSCTHDSTRSSTSTRTSFLPSRKTTQPSSRPQAQLARSPATGEPMAACPLARSSGRLVRFDMRSPQS